MYAQYNDSDELSKPHRHDYSTLELKKDININNTKGYKHAHPNACHNITVSGFAKLQNAVAKTHSDFDKLGDCIKKVLNHHHIGMHKKQLEERDYIRVYLCKRFNFH
eukprot:363843_1